jgi:hypothetical protein
MAWTYERGAAAGSHDADAAAVDAAAAAAEAACQDGSGSSYICPSRWDSLPASSDRRRGLDYDLASDVACEVEVGSGTAAMTLTSTSELVGWTVRQRWGAFDETCRPPPIMMMTNRCNVAYEMRKMSARETYMAHRKYFDGSPGEEGSIDDVSVAHDGNIGSGRVFRYPGGTRIPRSPLKI